MLTAIVFAAAIATAPPPVHGDFDHDGKIDVAELVHSQPGVYKLIIRRGAAGHPVSVIDTVKESDLANLYLTKAKPGRWQTWCGKGGDDGNGPCLRKFVVLHGDTLDYGTKESSEAVVIWTGRKFEVVWLSD